MRLLKLISWMLLCGTVSCLTSIAVGQSTTRVVGRIVAAKVRGSVAVTSTTDKTPHALKDNATIQQHEIVTTGPASSVILVFSNGATVDLGADSVLSIDEFLQDPFEKEVAVSQLKEEPTSSVTKLNLSRGEMVGNVKHLRQDRGSSFTIDTPVGAAGIRGTTFRIVFRPEAGGQTGFTLSTAEGAILFQALSGAGVSVDTGKELVVHVELKVDAATGAITLVSPPVVEGLRDIPAATEAIIAAAVQQIIEASTTNVGTGPTPSGLNPPPTNPSTNPQPDSLKNPSTFEDTIPAPTTPPSQTTHGDGKPG